MSRLQCRHWIARAAVVVALFSSRPADAQVIVDPSPTPQPGGLVNNLITGVAYDVVNQAKAERSLQYYRAKIERDAGRGHSGFVDHDARKIESLQYRIVVDEWLIRKNSLQAPGCYPFPLRGHPISCAAIAQMRSQPSEAYSWGPVPTPAPMVAAPTIPITIVNADPSGAGVAFAIDGVAHQAAGGSRQELAVAPTSNITYDGGGSVGPRRYQVSPGVYEFRSTPEGWALYKLPGTP